MTNFHTIAEIKVANAAADLHFFDPGTMRFFNSRVLNGVYGGRYFVTSEKGPDGVRAYSVRIANDDGSIDTVGEFQGFATARQAKAQARRLAQMDADQRIDEVLNAFYWTVMG